jgi:hypothetical protein
VITELRSAVAELLRSEQLGDVWEYVPADVAAYPCLVVGRGRANPSIVTGAIFDVSLTIYACGRPQSDDAQDELDKTVDAVIVACGGTRVRKFHDVAISVVGVIPSVVVLAGNTNVPCYEVTVETAVATC